MSERKTTKKVTKVDLSSEHKPTKKFVPSPENKKKATSEYATINWFNYCSGNRSDCWFTTLETVEST